MNTLTKQFLNILLFTFMMMSPVLMVQEAFSQKNRDEIDDRFKWNLKDIYESDDAWKNELSAQLPVADELLKFKGKLGESAKTLYTFLEMQSNFYKQLTRLSTYASMKSDQNTANTFYQGMTQEISQKFSAVAAKLSFVSPELSAIPKETIDKFMKSEKKLKKYSQFFDNLQRQKKYILSDKEERIIAEAGKLAQAPSDIYGIFSNAEMPFPTVTLSSGEKVYLDKAAYGRYRTTPNRIDRELIFKAFWDAHVKFRSTFATQLYSQINADVFSKNVRGYKSSLQASISKNNIPDEVYYSLIDNINKSLPTFHRYLGIKKRILEVDTLKYSDIYMSGVKGVDMNYAYGHAQSLVIRSSAMLGKDYAAVVEKAFNEGWVDVYPNKGKRSGAYSNGSAYDVHPYVLMNYNEKFDDVTTLAHEFGHAMHSYLSNKNQDFVNADYSIFVAEVASTLNERLLDKLVLDETRDDNLKLSLLMNILDGFRTTLFRQTQFAEFELKIHEEVEKGKPLTADVLNALYKDILYRYYGHNNGVCHIDDLYEIEWAYIPHFYYNFYVYQYATSFTASMALSHDIINAKAGAVEKYIKFLSSGSSKYPIDLLKDTGVDMTTSMPFEKTMAAMNYYMDEVEKILNKK
ncbi:MAG: oligoendopeptidase F [Deltaproteobacteria bacterium]